MTLKNKILNTALEEIDAFCQVSGLSVSDFGQQAMNDRSFVFDIRKGERSPSVKTLDRVSNFIAAHTPKFSQSNQPQTPPASK